MFLNGSIFIRSFLQSMRSYVRSFVSPCVRASITKCAIMYREQTAGSRSTIFRTQMHVDKIPSPANFHPNGQRR